MVAPRVLPDRPSLRYLKLEAKRRVATGEAPALHDAQRSIAKEHGLSSWAALKRLVVDQRGECQPLSHLRWLISRFAGADRPGWTAPKEAELLAHLGERLLEAIPPEQFVATAASHAADLRGQLSITTVAPLMAVVEIAGIRVIAVSEAAPPHRLNSLERFVLGSRVTDTRLTTPATSIAGEVPTAAPGILDRALRDLGVPGLVVAGRRGPATSVWAAARGWADVERGEALSPEHWFPATGITTLVTAVAVLLLVADGQVALDDPINRHLRSVHLADDRVSIRELLAHTGGVQEPETLFAGSVPPLEALCGGVMPCRDDRGGFRFSFGGYAALGQLVADITGSSYEAAVHRLVLAPLEMDSSFFPGTAVELAGGNEPDRAASPVTGYTVARDGSLLRETPSVCTLPAAGGLWTTAADLARFGLRWSSLLPLPLAREAQRPQRSRAPHLGHAGLGWLIAPNADLAGCAGGGPGSSASLLVRLSDHAVQVTMTNRRVPVESVGIDALRGAGGGTRA